MNNFQDNILNKIKTGEISMVPKWQFMLRAGLLFSGIVISLLLVLYLLSFILFFLRQSGVAFAPGFGFRGISLFLIASPWLLVGVSVVFLIVLYFLVKRYSFSFKQPLLYTMIGLVFFSVVCSWLIQQTSAHQRFGEFVERNEIPVFTPLYRDNFNARPSGVLAGTIVEITDSGFVLASEQGEMIEVVTKDSTRMRPGTNLQPEDTVMVFGDRDVDTITAFGVRMHHGDAMRLPSKIDGKEGRPPRYSENGFPGSVEIVK